ncbi:hypothetical protein FRC14_005781 [Serendipita sp. 396]|nr:hypothetical protein FRC14_005781 [Serendipita sp. 396]
MDIPPISDDALQSTIYITDDTDKSVLLVQITELVESTIPNHIWHRDSFLLTLSKERESALECTMRVGDSVDDEWLVVFLLWQVTQRFDVAISVTDADGQFLLIEAADVLPSWVTPENAENRVWVYQGHLHIIPLSFKSSMDDRRKHRRFEDDFGDNNKESPPSITILDALSTLKEHYNETQAPSEVENTVLKRIAGYPNSTKGQLHRTKVAIPLDVAKALAGNPHLVQKAVECFYTRDAIQLRPTQKMARFPPSTSSVVTALMTKTAYAQLMGQKFNAPKIFRRPLDQTANEARWWDNGVKIACGFEMLYQEARTRKEGFRVNGSNEVNDARLDALRRDSAYLTYIVHLENAGYFEDQLRDSKRWKEKEMEAAKKWISMRQVDDASRPSFADLVNDAIRLHPDAMLHDEGEDPDDWLNVEPKDVEQAIRQYQMYQHEQGDTDNGAKLVEGETEEDRAANKQAHKLKQLAEKMEGFVEGEGALEGALFEDELDSDDDEESVDSEDATVGRQAAMDALVAPLEPGEYGKMPAHYRHPNTQTVAPLEQEYDTEMIEKSKTVIPPTSLSARNIRRPVLERDKFDGVDSDDETTDEDDDALGTGALRTGDDEEEEDEEDQPQIVGDVEIDMGQEEEEFLRFSRDALGIDDATWESIIADREKRGVYIPPSMRKDSQRAESSPPPKGPSAAQFFDKIPNISVAPRPPRNKAGSSAKATSVGGAERSPNPDLDSFEAVMDAMEKELERLKSTPNQRPTSNAYTNQSKPSGKSSSSKVTFLDEKGKGKQDIKGKGRTIGTKEEENEGDGDAEMIDMQREMDVELRSKLKRELEVVSSEEEDSDEEMPMDYTLIKNFLESFKAQQGLAGPVSGLASRLQGSDWALPRDG